MIVTLSHLRDQHSVDELQPIVLGEDPGLDQCVLLIEGHLVKRPRKRQLDGC